MTPCGCNASFSAVSSVGLHPANNNAGFSPEGQTAWRIIYESCPATAGLVLGASTRPEVADVVGGPKQAPLRCMVGIGQVAVQSFHLCSNPADTGNLDLGVLADEEP